MKNKNDIPPWTCLVLALVFSVIAPSCSNDEPDDITIEDSSSNIASLITNKRVVVPMAGSAGLNANEGDHRFLNRAEQINLEEIQLGILAQRRGVATGIKELGKIMENEHIAAMAELKILAAQKNISISGSIASGLSCNYKLLDSQPGKEFDKAFLKIILAQNGDAITRFEEAAAITKDASIKSWSASMLLTLKTHNKKTLECMEAYKIQM